MTRNDYTAWGCFGMIVGFLDFLVIGPIVNGYVIEQLWNWFAVPLGAIPITTAWAIGLGVLVGALTYRDASAESTKKETSVTTIYIKAYATLFVRAGVALLIGRIALGYLG